MSKAKKIIVPGYKGFDKNMQCRGMQYEVGKTAKAKSASLCNEGLHFCEYPLDIFNYYSPNESLYCEVEAINPSEECHAEDTKRVTKELKIKAALTIPALVKASVDFILSKIETSKTESNTGDNSAATNTGSYSAATNTGSYSAATNTGNYSAATNTGNYSAATNTGNYSAATNTGDNSAATNTGYKSAATNTGYKSAAKVEGKESIAMSCGIEGKAAGSLGSWIILAEWSRDSDGEWHRIDVQCVKVDGEIIKPDVYYRLLNGSFVEVEE